MDNIKPCPFCGKAVDLDDYDTLYPSGTGWIFDDELQMRTYHHLTEVPKEQWCYGMHCTSCGAVKGQLHVENCDMEKCPICGGQALGCECLYYAELVG